MVGVGTNKLAIRSGNEHHRQSKSLKYSIVFVCWIALRSATLTTQVSIVVYAVFASTEVTWFAFSIGENSSINGHLEEFMALKRRLC